MKELSSQQIAFVSGGVSAFEQADKLFKGMLSFLTSDANPLNGRVLGQNVGYAIGSIFAELARSFVNAIRGK